ncbi:hypothetical protein [Halococcus salsus]|uniref:hypothetical protein n=1 Tax=Halococcus salsus TaxID=2162894 RepID=UPI00135CA881|nr:hypothetical protein [Halococcus salsus]
MDLRSQVGYAVKGARDPKKAIRHITGKRPFLRSTAVNLSSRGLLGTNVFSRDWDLLIVMDACRVDALRMVADEYSFVNDVDRMCSVGGSTPEWVASTFREPYLEKIRDTAYVTANAYADFIFEYGMDKSRWTATNGPEDHLFAGDWSDTLRKHDLGYYERAHRYEPQEGDGLPRHVNGSTPPGYVTDRGISVGRNTDCDRMILHYIQPHVGWVAKTLEEGRDQYLYESDASAYLMQGGSREVAFGAYLDELRYVLDSIEVLLDNIDAEKVAITADHGEAFGEYLRYDHHVGSLDPQVRFVPWAETTATDSRNYEPRFASADEATSEEGMAEQLAALGYVDE